MNRCFAPILTVFERKLKVYAKLPERLSEITGPVRYKDGRHRTLFRNNVLLSLLAIIQAR